MEIDAGAVDEQVDEQVDKNHDYQNEQFVPILKKLIKNSGGVRVFCDKYSLPLAVVSLVANGKRNASKELVDKIFSISVLRQHFTNEQLPISSSPLFLRQIKNTDSTGTTYSELDLKAQRLLDESNELLARVRSKDFQDHPEASRSKTVEQLLENHRRKIAREEAVLLRVIKAAEQKEEAKRMRAYSKSLAQLIISKTHSGVLTSNDLTAIAQILNKAD